MLFKKILNADLKAVTNFFLKANSNRLFSTESTENNTLKKVDDNKSNGAQIYDKSPESKTKRRVTRKQPFKYYFDDEEREKSKIMFYENFFDQNTKYRDRDNFMSAIEAFRLTNPSKNMYIDFIYGALMKMKDYNAHTHLEAYRKLMELFPVGPLRSSNAWQRENFHFPRHQSAAMLILEQAERNGLIIDEQFAALTVKVFGDWTHVVRKAKRQLYWLPKFKNANPYPVPTISELENWTNFDIALAALERITKCADRESKITVHMGKEFESDDKEKWIISAQSSKQKELLSQHKKDIPIYIEGPNFTWIRNKLVNYFVMKTDPLKETKEAYEEMKARNDDDFSQMRNIFSDPFKKENKTKKDPSVHEQLDGVVYALCTTESSSKLSVNNWTKILEASNSKLKDYIIVYRMKENPGNVVIQEPKEED